MPSVCCVWMSVSSVPFIHGDLVVVVGMLGKGKGGWWWCKRRNVW